ncbi:carboxylesterase/lipase family protein [Sphingobium sp. EP60837]|uniref:carboxylesterase/lipase family protein n=1 Tax=Sphingobium sp. EP60837 TaxID=1855519 RepID=UPI0007DDBB2F|nr:carboxylesterase family protein [Sphingobium sp. EP60837]ANI80096.1 Fumonisin B1 esterase [Sphingobium sp. EP60837]
MFLDHFLDREIGVGCARVLTTAMAVSLACSHAAAELSPDFVSVTSGKVQGEQVDGVLSFKGIPYAAPPVGALRWRAPQAPKAWKDVLQARSFAPDCMQKVDRNSRNVGIPLILTEPSEDCLYLNIWRPAASTAKPLPVMVWFYGGGFSVGGTSPILFQGDSFARQGVVVVSFNYRLGRFGFFAHPALTKSNPGEPKANYAFLDQIAALKWVRKNIAAFGGDPANVTIFGESAGGVAVNAMMVSPLAKGLFQKAIVQSGPTHGLNIRELHRDQPGRQSLEKFGLAFATSKGIEGPGADALAKLRALPAEALIDLSTGLPGTVDESRTPWGGPTMDGKILPVVKGDYFKAGKFAPVSLIIGANSDDVTASTGVYEDQTIDYTLARFGDHKAEALRSYDPDGTGDPRVIRHKVSADDHMIEPGRFVATETANRGAKVYRYYFSYIPEALQTRWTYGAPHGGELAFAFDVLRLNYGPAWSDQDLRVAKTMNTYWANFAKTGNPNGPGLPEWPLYKPSSDQVLQFMRNGSAAAAADPLKPRLDLAEKVSEPRRVAEPSPESTSLPKWPLFRPVKN